MLIVLEQCDNPVDALEVVEGLVEDSKVRGGIFDTVKGELIYDSASPVDLRSRPDFQVATEGPWVERFVSTLGELRPDLTTNSLTAMGQRQYPDLRHECPETVAWDEFRQCRRVVWMPGGTGGTSSAGLWCREKKRAPRLDGSLVLEGSISKGGNAIDRVGV